MQSLTREPSRKSETSIPSSNKQVPNSELERERGTKIFFELLALRIEQNKGKGSLENSEPFNISAGFPFRRYSTSALWMVGLQGIDIASGLP
eukprot:snap_masked-scaffold_29-processed-gene-3.23-mRNA-1 protein AED:1.00 eAED:1.00 QI:0/-1/0/0/-1/1/1/0/91